MTLIPRWTVQIAIAETLALDNRSIEQTFGLSRGDARKRRHQFADVISNFRNTVQKVIDAPTPPNFDLPPLNTID